MRLVDRCLLLLVALMWGVNFVAGKGALTAFTPWEFRAITFGGGAGVLFVIAVFTRTRLRIEQPRDLACLLIAGMFSIGGFGVFSAIALLHTTAGRTTICVYTMPIWTVLFSRFALAEPLTRSRIVSMFVGATGLTLLASPLVLAGDWAGPLAAIAAALSWAIGTIVLKRAGLNAAPLTTTTWQLAAGTILAVIGLVLDPRDTPLEMTGNAMLGILYSLVFGTIAAYLVWFSILQRVPAGAAGMGTLLVPVFGVLASFILLREIPTTTDIIGLVLIACAAMLPLSETGTRYIPQRDETPSG